MKADKALTLFMINTLAENARKYTQSGGSIQVYAREEADYVEISVQDNGPGLSEEDMACILNEKVYDSGKIGVRTTSDVDALQKSKGSGFGLMNCKGIIEKYRKTNEVFRVCSFRIESKVGEGSRFYFRLPKGVRRVLAVLMCLLLPMGSQADDTVLNDSLLHESNRLANAVYHANLEGKYAEALEYADSALNCMNQHFMKHASFVAPLLQLVGEGAAAELKWFDAGFESDYHVLLDVRNEAAVAYLALGELDAYRYNNQAYTSLYKQISVDASLEEYCERMQLSTNGKWVAVILCLALLVALLAGYYFLYLRHRLAFRHGLEQVLEINRRALAAPVLHRKEKGEFVSELVDVLYKELGELISMDALGMAIVSDESHGVDYAFSELEEGAEEMKLEMLHCIEKMEGEWKPEKKWWCLPLCVEIGGEKRCLGAMCLQCATRSDKEDDRLLLELVTGYVAIIVYHAVELVAQKYRDIEVAQDEARRVVREENQLHVQNMVLDNCLSTIKHETIYYPNRIKQIIDRLHEGMTEEEERRQVETIGELIVYYKDVFTMLSSCASRQLEEVTFRRSVVKAMDLSDAATRYFKRATKKRFGRLEWKTEVASVEMTGDVIQLKYLLENLINEALTHSEEGELELRIYKEGDFVRFDFIDRRRCPSQEELNQLFYPRLSHIQHRSEGVLSGTEYLVCKQIIRDHDEFAGRRGCRMNACQAEGGGFMVWFTIPAR